MSILIHYGGQNWWLLSERALWHESARTLFVADIHLGKGAAFRAAGVPVPTGSTVKDLDRLTELLLRHNAKRLIILGDFFHARSGRSDEVTDAIGQWRRRHALVEMLLVRGNHDRSAGRVLSDWDIEEIDGCCEEDGIILSHAPPKESDRPVLAGHVHPVYSLRDFDGTAVRVPCFVFDERCAILPSFGTLTGGYRIEPQPGRRIYVIAGSRIVRVPA